MESAAGLVDMGRMQSTLAEKLDIMRDEQRLLTARLSALEGHLSAAAEALLRVPELIERRSRDSLEASEERSQRGGSAALQTASRGRV